MAGENRASFILEKLAEGYDNDELRDELGFTLADIQQARQTRAIAEMARSMELPEEVKGKLENPRAKVFSTLKRVFDSSVGRRHLRVEPDAQHGIRGTTTKAQFVRGFRKLVSDVALGRASSRTLNTNDNIDAYFNSLAANERPAAKRGSFVPSDIIQDESIASGSQKREPLKRERSRAVVQTVLPRDFKVRFGNDRITDIRRELTKLKRADYPNAGAVLLRVFLELSAVHYLERVGELPKILAAIEKKTGHKPKFGVPPLSQLTPHIIRIAKNKLKQSEVTMVEKALRYDPSAPFSVNGNRPAIRTTLGGCARGSRGCASANQRPGDELAIVGGA